MNNTLPRRPVVRRPREMIGASASLRSTTRSELSTAKLPTHVLKSPSLRLPSPGRSLRVSTPQSPPVDDSEIGADTLQSPPVDDSEIGADAHTKEFAPSSGIRPFSAPGSTSSLSVSSWSTKEKKNQNIHQQHKANKRHRLSARHHRRSARSASEPPPPRSIQAALLKASAARAVAAASPPGIVRGMPESDILDSPPWTISAQSILSRAPVAAVGLPLAPKGLFLSRGVAEAKSWHPEMSAVVKKHFGAPGLSGRERRELHGRFMPPPIQTPAAASPPSAPSSWRQGAFQQYADSQSTMAEFRRAFLPHARCMSRVCKRCSSNRSLHLPRPQGLPAPRLRAQGCPATAHLVQINGFCTSCNSTKTGMLLDVYKKACPKLGRLVVLPPPLSFVRTSTQKNGVPPSPSHSLPRSTFCCCCCSAWQR